MIPVSHFSIPTVENISGDRIFFYRSTMLSIQLVVHIADRFGIKREGMFPTPFVDIL